LLNFRGVPAKPVGDSRVGPTEAHAANGFGPDFDLDAYRLVFLERRGRGRLQDAVFVDGFDGSGHGCGSFAEKMSERRMEHTAGAIHRQR
jgi:hypothetical protein